MIQLSEQGDRKFTIAFWFIEEIIFAVMFWTVSAGIARGLEWHPAWYLEASCIAFALISCVIPVLRLTGAVKMPWWFNFLLTIDVYIYTISLCLGFYMDPTIPWWGFFGHVLSSMSVGGIVFLALCLIEKYSPSHVTIGNNAAIHCYTLMISLAFGGIWEVMEGYVDVLLGQSVMVYGDFDTLDDLRADLVGSVLMVVLAAFMLRGRTALDIANTTVFRNPRKKEKKEE